MEEDEKWMKRRLLGAVENANNQSSAAGHELVGLKPLYRQLRGRTTFGLAPYPDKYGRQGDSVLLSTRPVYRKY